jgi:hypothetical protein
MLGHLSAKRPKRSFNTPAFPHFYSHTQAHPRPDAQKRTKRVVFGTVLPIIPDPAP